VGQASNNITRQPDHELGLAEYTERHAQHGIYGIRLLY